MADITSKSDEEIDTWIANHVHAGKTDAPLYRELLEERGRRSHAKHKLDIQKSLECIMAAARAQTCTTYGALASASGVPWAKVRHAMDGRGGHLDRLLDICHARGLPLLTALVVSEGDVESGELGDYPLHGFCEGARRLGLSMADEREFHRAQREASWEWGRRVQRTATD